MSADSAATEGAPQTSNEPILDSESSQEQPFDGASASDLMEQLGIPSKVAEKYVSPAAEEEAPEAPAETPEAISLEPDPEPDKEQEPEPEDDEEEVEDKVEAAAPPEVAKLQKRNYKLRQRARRAEDEAADLRQKLEKAGSQEPITVTPTVADPLAHVQTIEQLKAEREKFKLLRNWAREHPDGWTSPDGSQQVTPEAVAQNLSYAEDILSEQFPQKEKEIAEIRPRVLSQAKTILPSMLVHGTEDNVAYNNLLRQYPMLANHPEREAFAALVLRGWKAVSGDVAQQKEESKDAIPRKILQAAEQRTKTPVLKQTPPGRTTVPVVSVEKRKAELLAKVKKAGGDSDSMLEALNEYDRLHQGSNGSRAPVPA